MIKTWHITGNTTNNMSFSSSSDPGGLWGRFVVAPQTAARRRRVVFGRSTRGRQKRRDEDDAAADSMSNLVVRTCTREREGGDRTGKDAVAEKRSKNNIPARSLAPPASCFAGKEKDEPCSALT